MLFMTWSLDVCSSVLAETGLASPALVDRFDPMIGADETEAMLARAPLDLRTNRLAGTRDGLAALFPGGQAIAGAPDGWRLPPETAAVQNPAYAEGDRTSVV